LARNDLFTRYKKSVLGIFWTQINPLLTTVVIYFVFGRLINHSTPLKRGYFLYVYTGILFQNVLLNGLTQTGQSLASNAPLLLKTRIRPVVFTFAAALGSVLNFLIGFILVFPLALITHVPFSSRIFLLPLLALALTFFLTGAGMFLSGFYIRFDDFNYFMGVFMMIAAYLSPIFYPLDILSHQMRILVSLNPLTSWIVLIRWICFSTSSATAMNVTVVILSQVSIFVLGVLWIRHRWNSYMVLL
jgi:ABC-type polysaccharide/polyol phosphate export permease